METFETDFLAEEWYDFLKEEVEPRFQDIRFEKYTPSAEYTSIKYADRVAIIIDDKALFKYSLKGNLINRHTVKTSLIRYVEVVHSKRMIER